MSFSRGLFQRLWGSLLQAWKGGHTPHDFWVWLVTELKWTWSQSAHTHTHTLYLGSLKAPRFSYFKIFIQMHNSSLHTGKSHPTNRERQERERGRGREKNNLKSQTNVKGFLGRSKGGEKAAAQKREQEIQREKVWERNQKKSAAELHTWWYIRRNIKQQTYVLVAHVPIRSLPEGHDFPHDDTEAPHIRSWAVTMILNGLWSSPQHQTLPSVLKDRQTVMSNKLTQMYSVFIVRVLLISKWSLRRGFYLIYSTLITKTISTEATWG